MPEEQNPTDPQPSSYERFITWAADLPWWAIILGIVVVVVLYSMLSSTAYRRVIQSLTDDPQVSTDDLFETVQIVGEPTIVSGRFVGESQDSLQTVISEFLQALEEFETDTKIGFVEDEDAASITVRTLDGDRLTVPKSIILTEERTEDSDGFQISLTYIDRVTVTGTLTERNDDTMTIRTQDEETETFSPARILSREVTTIPCDPDAAPDCEPTEQITFVREGEVLNGTLKSLSNTNILVAVGNENREIRRLDVDYFYVPTLTVAINAASENQAVADGQTVRIAYLEGSDLVSLLASLDAVENVPVPLRYADGTASMTLVPFADLETALEATGAGEVDGFIYLDSGPERMAVSEWVDANPDAGVLVVETGECEKNCEVTVKLVDDTVTGRVSKETADSITIVTQDSEFLVLDRDKILENRRMDPGVCALNNLRGCNAGVFLTLRVTFQAYALALIIGLIVGLMRVPTNPTNLVSKLISAVITAVSTLYVEVVRGIPLLVILLYAGFVISPELRDTLGIDLSDEQEAVLGLSFGYGAFIAEIFRAGIQSISRGQMEAARSLGMSYPQAMRYVVLPQAIRVVLPPLGNDFIAMLKDSALISVLALPDLLQLGRLYVSRTFRAFEGYNTVAVLYLIMTLFLSTMVRIIEKRSRLPE